MCDSFEKKESVFGREYVGKIVANESCRSVRIYRSTRVACSPGREV